MQIWINDKPHQVEPALSLLALLDRQGLLKPAMALAINQAIVPRDQWPDRLLNDGDHLLIFQAIAGG